MNQDKYLPVFVGIVDDEADIANLFRDALNSIPGVSAFGFTDPQLALLHVRENCRNYRCIVSDYRMPVMNGIELLEKVKSLNPDISRILMSAFEIEDHLIDKRECVDAFLQKPVRISNLIEQVQNSVSQAKARPQID